MDKITAADMIVQWERAAHEFPINMEALKVLGPRLADLFRDNISNNSYFGTFWTPPLATSTLERRIKYLAKYPPIGNGAPTRNGNRMLLERGVLWGSITSVIRKLPGNGFRAHIYPDPRKFRMNDSRHQYNYARIHNSGMGKTPKRQFMPDSSKDYATENESRKDIKIVLEEITTKIFIGFP